MSLLDYSTVDRPAKVGTNMKTCYKIILFLILCLNTALVGFNIAMILLQHFEVGTTSEQLLLTPLIEQGQIELSQKLSKVHHPKIPFESYSGYLTVDASTDSHLFFWYFPSMTNTNGPIILWLNGGPGTSSLYGLFAEIGPLYIQPSGDIARRKDSWNEHYSLLFIDNPVGTGFSRTTNGHITGQLEAGRHLHTALKQFYQLFPDLVNRDLHIACQSYGGKFATSLGHAIHMNNQRAKQKINLKGLIIGNGWIDPINQINYGDYLYEHGLLDMQEASIFRTFQDKCIDLISKQKYLDAYRVYSDMIFDDSYYTPYGTLFTNFSGFKNFFHVLETNNIEPIKTYITEFLNQKDIMQALHVGDTEFQIHSKTVARKLNADALKSVAMWLSELLSNYKVLLYAGQLDIIVSHISVENSIMKMNFSSVEEFKRARREKWYVGNDLAGYVKTAGNLTYISVRNSGHMVVKDQLLWSLDMVDRFINNKSFN